MQVDFRKIEEEIDNYLYNKLDDSIPRNKYIYHCNLAYIDIVTEYKILFTIYERHYVFSLTYNTFLAHKKLKEEDKWDYKFDSTVHKYACEMIIEGMIYSLLCNVFPLLHSDKAVLIEENNTFSFRVDDIPRRNFKFINDYSIRKYLNYNLQMKNGRMEKENIEDNDIEFALVDTYLNFWNENMFYDDFEPYTREQWGGFNLFFLKAAMKRFNKLYKNDFDIVKTDSQKMMIILSPQGAKSLMEYIPESTDKVLSQLLNDNVYKVVSKNNFPKLSVLDSPINKTKDGFLFVNPFIIIYNDSLETRYLNNLRKCDRKRHNKIKEKIKERVIPLLQEMIKLKFPNAKSVSNFMVTMPNNNKNRECDLLIVDENGCVLYVEIKHYYYPNTQSECKLLDRELNQALDKMPEQLQAIKHSWNDLKLEYNLGIDLNEINGIICSHRFTGWDVRVDEKIPIISNSVMYENIADADCIKDIYSDSIELEKELFNIKFIKKKSNYPFDNKNFEIELEALDPNFEIELIKQYRKNTVSMLKQDTGARYENIAQLAKAYIEEINS